MARKVPEINASSTADIAFLLLIFFLVATTMNVDSGIRRQLPPMPEDNEIEALDVNRRNLLLVFVNASDAIMVGGQLLDISQVKDRVKDFISNPTNDPNKPEKINTDIDILGNYPVSRGVISLTNDRGTSYNMYVMVQNELTRAFNELRNELAERKFNKKFSELSEEQAKAVSEAIPTRISEAEPRNVGGN
ncbi:MAG: biopolymer transporter ExbD [Rikenellaceae bacterium]|nr:biopolymer transporter ExbD [Rikenellaceae bacterium]